MKKTLLFFVSLVITNFVIACDHSEIDYLESEFNIIIDTEKNDSVKNSSIDTTSIKIPDGSKPTDSEQTIHFSTRIIGNGIIKSNSLIYNNARLSGQGMAIYGNFMFRLHHSGYCCVYDLDDINNIQLVGSFPLASYSSDNHANCAQFAKEVQPDTGFPLLYVSNNSSGRKCTVEKISSFGSELIQSISFKSNVFLRTPNTIIGDDGYLWTLGSVGSTSSGDYGAAFYKFNAPSLDIKDAIIEPSDTLDHFQDIGVPQTWQGGIVKKGKAFFLYGTSSINRQIRVYDTTSHKRLCIINLNNITTAEPEDLDIWKDNKIILVLNGVDYAILIEFEDNLYIP